MPFDVQGARAAGYRDDEIAGYLSYSSGEPADTLPGIDEEKIAELLRRRDRSMLPYSYAEQTPFDRAVAQPPEPAPDYLSRPDATFSPDIPEEAVLPSPVRTARDFFRPGVTMPVQGGPVGSGIVEHADIDIPEAARSIAALGPGSTGEQRAAGVSSLARMGMHGAMPLILPAVGRAPVQTLMGLAYGGLGGYGTEHYLREAGVAPGYAALGGDIFGLGAGAVAGAVPWREVPSRMGDLLRNEAGEITISPSKGWTSTLRDLVEQKAPGRVSPQQLAAIAAQAPKEEVRWSMGDLARGTEPLPKSEVLGGIQQPEITEILRTAPDTKFDRPGLVLSGGEGKTSELLLQMPQDYDAAQAARDSRILQLVERRDALETQPPSTERARQLRNVETQIDMAMRDRGPIGYRSGHWSEPNVFAHARFNERTTPAGEKVLLVEEAQSDWLQLLRKWDAIPKAQEQAKAAHDAWNQKQLDFNEHLGTGESPEQTRQRFGEIEQAQQAYEKALAKLDAARRAVEGTTRPPDAPFATDWHELLMKRMIAEAIAKGSDKLAWTTGEQQAERYNLAKHFDRLEWAPSRYSETSGEFSAYDKQGNPVHEASMEHGELAELIGKEMAERLLGQPVRIEAPLAGGGSRRHVKILEGTGLEVGGEGMKGFYDKMLPDFARKYGKKFGANVSQTEIEVPGDPINEIYEGPHYTREQMADWVRQNRWSSPLGDQAARVLDFMRGGADFSRAMGRYGSPNLARELGGEMHPSPPSTVTVHSMDITPEMRRSLAGGQPLFGSAVKQSKSLSELAK